MTDECRAKLTLCEALDWCRVNRAIVHFNKSVIAVNLGTMKRTTGISLEEAVSKMNDQLVKEAAEKGFKGE